MLGIVVDLAAEMAENPELTGFQLIVDAKDVSPPGYPIRLQWSGASGARTAELSTASLTVMPALAEESLGELQKNDGSNNVVVNIPESKRISSLKLEGLAYRDGGGDWLPINSGSDLSTNVPRLVISIPDARVGWIPLYTVPEVPQRGVMPKMYTGATFSGNRLLKLPAEVSVPKLRIAVVKNSNPEDFQPLSIKITDVYGWASLPPRDLEVVDPGGQVVWAYPGEFALGSAAPPVDLRQPMETALAQALEDGTALDLTYRLRGKTPSKAVILQSGPSGALVRTFPGVVRTELRGDPLPVGLLTGAEDKPLASEQPSTVTADLNVRYEGIRILETVSDPAPSASGGIGGQVVGVEPVWRDFPPAALTGYPLWQIGLVGRAPETCEISVQLVDLSTGKPGKPLGPPGVLQLEPDLAIATRWVDLNGLTVPPGPLGLSVRANQGRFFWVSDPHPLVRVAIQDPDPGGRPVRLEEKILTTVVEEQVSLTAADLSAFAFNSRPPVLASDLFLTVDLEDLTLRYHR